MTLAQGQQIGQYTIERTLGTGGMGMVYVAVDSRLGRRAAIKQLLPQFSADRDIVDRFFNEAKAAASINHPSIVEIYDVGWHNDGSAFFAMKLLEGESVGRRMRTTQGMRIEIAATITRQVATALGAAHARFIVHRDMKPDNIMLVRDDEVVIGERAIVLDFGIAKLFRDGGSDSKTRTGVFMGTPAYMSPEQCRGAADVDHRTDIYALGCILFEMLTGRPPFIGQGSGEIVGMHQYVAPPMIRSFRPDVPEALEALIARCIAKDPAARYASMTELAQALSPFAVQGVHTLPADMRGVTQLTVPPAAMPSTYASSSGEISKRGPGQTSSNSAGLTGRIFAFVFGVLALAAITTIVVVMKCSPTTKTDEPPPENQIVLAQTAPELKQQMEEAIKKQDWKSAARAAQKWLALEGSNQDAQKALAVANAEMNNKRQLAEFAAAVKKHDWETGMQMYRGISSDSVYYQRSIDYYRDLEQAFIEAHEKQAHELVDKGDCKAHQEILTQASKISPQAYEALAYRCVPAPASKTE